MARKPKPDPAWCTKAELLTLFGISSNSFDRTVKPAIPPEAMRAEKGVTKFWYHAPTVFRIRVAQLADRELANAKTAGEKIRQAQQLKQAGQAAAMALLKEFCNAARSKPKAKRGKHVRKARGLAQARLPMSRLLQLLGVTAEQLSADLGPFLSNVRTGPAGVELMPADVMQAAVLSAIAATPVPDDVPDDDADDGVEGSPELERWRKARADLAELELQRQQAKLLPRDIVRSMVVTFAASIRRFGEVLQRQSPDLLALLDEHIDEAERAAGAVLAGLPDAEDDE